MASFILGEFYSNEKFLEKRELIISRAYHWLCKNESTLTALTPKANVINSIPHIMVVCCVTLGK